MKVGKISPRARNYVRRAATANMGHVVRIERVNKATFDEEDLVARAGTRVTIYEGPARLWESTGQGVVQIGDDNVVMQSTNLSIPWNQPPAGDPQPLRDDEFTIISSNVDTTVVGKRGVLLDVAKAGELRATRRFAVQMHQGKGDHG